MITSVSNIQVKNIVTLLKKNKERREQGAFVIEGRKMFEEVLEQEHLLVKAYFSEHYFTENYSSEKPEFPFEILSDSVFSSIAETITPQGVMAIVKMPQYNLKQMLTEDAALLLLENVRDPGNLGTMVRTAEAAGISGILLSREAVDMYNPKVIRSTMGAIFRVPFLYVEDFEKTLRQLREEKVRLFAAHLKGTKTFDQADFSGRIGILIGNEANGLSDAVAELAEEKVIIPMAGQVESLNAAIAAALLMYEAARKRW